MAEATIDELQIEISSDSNSAAAELDKLRQSLERLLSPVQALTTGNGLNKLTKQLEKLAEAGRAISNLSGLDKIAQAANALKSLDTLTGAPKVGGYVSALNKLSAAGGSVQAIAAFPDISAQLNSLTNALNQLRNIQDIRLGSLMNALSQLPAAVQAINGMPNIDKSKMRALSSALNALKVKNITQISRLVNVLNKLPQAAQAMNQVDFSQFASSIRQLLSSLEPLIQRAESAGESLNSLAVVLRATGRQSTNTGGIGGLGRTLGSLSTKSLISWASLIKLKNVLADCFNISAQYVENLNLFNVTMGKSAESAFEFAEAVNAALGIDTSDWIRYQGFFQSVGKGFGVVSDKADLMSKNLTQLSYDISSFYNISTEEAYNKVQSGFAGELEPLRRLGFALDEATLKQLAYSKGITQTYESMTQAQKSQLRYVAMIEQAKNIGVTGDMSRTIDTASNGVRVLEARIQQLTRALGNMLMPMLSAILPYVTAFVQVLTEAANELANFFGFELPKIDLSGVSNGYDDIASAADNATAATEKFKGSLAGVDQLNIIGSHNDSSSGTGYSTDLDIDLPSYDFLNGVESKTKEIAENIKKWFQEALPWIEAVGTAIGSIFIGTKIAGFVNTLKNIKNAFAAIGKVINDNGGKKLFGAAAGFAAGATSGVLLYNSIKNLIKGTGDLANNWVQLGAGIGVAGTAIGLFVAASNPVGAVVTLVGSLAGAIIGCTTAVQELTQETYNSVFYSDVGTSIQTVADKYTTWTGEITKADDKVAENQQAIENNKKTIEESLGTLDDLAKSFEASGNMSEEAAQKIKEASQTITEAISSNLTTNLNNIILSVGESWDIVSEKAGLAKDAIIDALYADKNQGNEALTALQKQISGASATLATADKGSAEYNSALQTYEEASKKLRDVSLAAMGTQQTKLETQLFGLTDDKIALMDKETALSAVQQIESSYKEAADKMLTTKMSGIQSNNELVATLKALGVDTDYSKYDALNAGIEENYNTRISQLSGETLEILNKLKKQVNDSSSAAGTAAAQELWDRASKSIYDGAENIGDVITNAASQAGASITWAGAWWRGAFGGTDVNTVLRDDYAKESGAADISKQIDDAISEVNATAVVNVTREMKSQGPAAQMSAGYAREAMSDVYNESVVNQTPAATPEVVVNLLAKFDGDDIAASVQQISEREFQLSGGR